MGHSVLSQGIVMSASPSIRLSEVLSPPQQRISAAPQSLPSRPCSCGFSTVEPGVIWRWLPARGKLFNSEWDAMGCVKRKLATQVKRALHFFFCLSLIHVHILKMLCTGTTMWLILKRGFKSLWSCPGWSAILVSRKKKRERKKNAPPPFLTYEPRHDQYG